MAISTINDVTFNEEFVRKQNDIPVLKNEQNNFETARAPVLHNNNENQMKVESNNKITHNELQDALTKLNNAIEIFNKRLKFTIHDDSKQVVVKIIDSKTNKVVREIPPKEVLNFIARLHKFLGIFIDKRR